MLYTDTLQGMADALAYLQYYLHKVTKRQNNLEININNTFSALTAQLQQLTQLVSNSSLQPSALVANSLPFSILASLSLVNPCSQACPKLFSSLDFNSNYNTGQVFLNSYILYICLAPE